jgi:uncharacterized protein with HEPN domain
MTNKGQLRIHDYIEHILIAIDRINQYTAGMTLEEFLFDLKTQDAVIRNFENIGEASRNIARHYPEFSDANSQVPWGFAYEMRNVLAHGYFKVDLNIVWTTIQKDISGLKTKILSLKTN